LPPTSGDTLMDNDLELLFVALLGGIAVLGFGFGCGF
jgi:hypothetical protein